MAEIRTTGRLGSVKEVNGGYVSVGIAEPSYKNKDGEYVNSWFNFVLKGDNPTAKFLVDNKEKIDVLEVFGTLNQAQKDGKTEMFVNVRSANVITWKKAGTTANDTADTEDGEEAYPWE